MSTLRTSLRSCDSSISIAYCCQGCVVRQVGLKGTYNLSAFFVRFPYIWIGKMGQMVGLPMVVVWCWYTELGST